MSKFGEVKKNAKQKELEKASQVELKKVAESIGKEQGILLQTLNLSREKNIIIFQARKGAIEGGESGPVGHVFLKLGYELDNGNTYINHVYGYYPSGSGKKVQAKEIFGGTPGEIIFSFPEDMRSDLEIKYYLTEELNRNVEKFIGNYTKENPTYSLLSGDNCVKFVFAVANSIGLQVPSVDALTLPSSIISFIIEKNGNDPKLLINKEKNLNTEEPSPGSDGENNNKNSENPNADIDISGIPKTDGTPIGTVTVGPLSGGGGEWNPKENFPEQQK